MATYPRALCAPALPLILLSVTLASPCRADEPASTASEGRVGANVPTAIDDVDRPATPAVTPEEHVEAPAEPVQPLELVEVEPAGEPDTLTVSPADASPTEPLPPTEATDETVEPAAIDDPEAPAEPVLESRALGIPNGIFDLGPPGSGDAAAHGMLAWLAAMDPRTSGVARTIVALAVVLVLVMLVRMIFSRAGGPFAGGRRPSGVVRVLARYPVARGQHVVLLALGSRVLLLHQNGTAMRTLTEIVDADEVASLLSQVESGRREGERSFQNLLRSSGEACDRALGRNSRSEAETVDLTRSQVRGLSRLLARGGRVA